MNATAEAIPSQLSTPPVQKGGRMAELVLEQFFVGRLHARGAFYGRFDKLVRWLSVVIDCSWDGRTLSLAEDFAYDDGEVDHKTWRFTRTTPRNYVATREDVVGSGRAFADGESMRLDYVAALPTQKWGPIHLRFRDILTLQADGTLLNRAIVSKWGIRIGHVELVMTPEARTV